ncbi:hypothetical protein WJX72_008514 [[Myrmecia] bisecta]|uniref:ADP,ATP carrier protein n=1 Tax=[Myrmecia] bisecta TaxID=41462 RepID=A0AAW1PXS2_9CHLO
MGVSKLHRTVEGRQAARDIWSHAFTLLQRDVTDCGLLLLDPPFNLQAIQQTAAEVIFEEFRFQHYLAAPAAPLSIRQHHLENPSCRASSAGCGLVVDAGFSFTHAVPVLDHQIVAQGVRRVGIGGKVLTNYLKELISYRSINMMEETYLVEQIKEAACLVSQDLKRDLNLARQPGGQSPFRCEYVLPDGLESMRGHLRPWQARPAAPKGSCKEQAVSLNNERFMVPELVFNPSDISLPQAGLAQTVFEAVDALHPDLHAPLFSNIVLTGGTARCPGFAPRLQQELRALVDSDLQVNVTLAKDPTVAAWQGGSLVQARPSGLHRPALSVRPSCLGPTTFAAGKGLADQAAPGPLGSFCGLDRERVTKRPGVSASATAAAASVPAESGSPKTFLGIEYFTWQKILPLGLMFFCILFNYTILRDTKDVLVVTAPGSGAEVIPFLKTWVNLPMAIGFTVLYAKLANVLSTEALFYTCIIPFIAFFAGFAFLMYPLREVLHPTALAAELLTKLGPRFAGPIAILRNWTFCLFYVMAELWGSVVVSLLFWGFSNQICTVDEAKVFYPLFGLGANVALVFSGRAVKYFSQVRANLPAGVDGWGYSLKGMMGMVAVGGLIITLAYWGLNRTVVPRMTAAAPKKKKEKMHMSVGESFNFLAKSSYIRDLALLVVSYGISINLVEVTWKSKIKAQFPNPNDYSAFMGDFSSATGVVTFLMMIASRFIFKKYGWGVAALITPSVLLITGILFFVLVLGSGPLTPMLAGIGLTPLMAAVLVGAAQNIFSKSSKYSLFDPCKEMAYIPLDTETQVKGKAAIDVVCNPLGKSGGALIQQFMIVGFGSLAASTPYLGAILLGIVLMWMKAAASLNKQFTALEMKQKMAQSRGTSRSRKYKFVSKLNDLGFIEGQYVPLEDGELVTASMDVVESDNGPPPVPASSPKAA